MALIVNTNIASLTAQRNLNTNQSLLATSLQRLSSGLRLNSAKDDAAGMAISQSLTAQVRGNTQAVRNANDGISLAQTAEGALGQVANNLQRIRELAVQASNATVSDDNRLQLQKEVDQLTQEISRIVQTTSFNGTSLLSAGSAAASLTFQVGANGSATNQVSISLTNLASAAASAGQGVSAAASAGGMNTYNSDLAATGTLTVTTSANASGNISSLDADISQISNFRSTFGAIQNRFDAVISNLQNYVENLSAANSPNYRR